MSIHNNAFRCGVLLMKEQKNVLVRTSLVTSSANFVNGLVSMTELVVHKVITACVNDVVLCVNNTCCTSATFSSTDVINCLELSNNCFFTFIAAARGEPVLRPEMLDAHVGCSC